jgi:hypothetical protein
VFLLSWVERGGVYERDEDFEGEYGAGVCIVMEICVPGGVVSNVLTVVCLLVQYLRCGVCCLGRLGFSRGWFESTSRVDESDNVGDVRWSCPCTVVDRCNMLEFLDAIKL